MASIDEAYNIRSRQDTLVDFCFYMIRHCIAFESKGRKFMKAFQKDNLHELDLLLAKEHCDE